jgi:soluble lytic murein transglycosylase-like protein
VKLSSFDNANIVIQANVNKLGDFDLVHKVSKRITGNNSECYAVASEDEFEEWVHVVAIWANYQGIELKDAYAIAKKEVLDEIKNPKLAETPKEINPIKKRKPKRSY